MYSVMVVRLSMGIRWLGVCVTCGWLVCIHWSQLFICWFRLWLLMRVVMMVVIRARVRLMLCG